MKFFTSQFTFLRRKRARSNIKRLGQFLMLLSSLITVYSITFHVLMVAEGQNHSLITGFYWTLTVMSTLGFGDITFTTDVGRIFSVVVLLSGMIFLLVLLPFTFIEFFYAPWMKAQEASRTPRDLDEEVEGHVIMTNYDAVTSSLIQKLKNYNIPHYLLVSELQKAQEFYDQDIPVLMGSLDDMETYRRIHVEKAAMVVATNKDEVNTNIAFTVRELSDKVKIAVTANTKDSVDILKLAGATQVLELGEMLGKSLARRILSGSAMVHLVGRFDQLLIGEALVMDTPLVGKTIKESKLRELTGVTIVGLWDRGTFKAPLPDTEIHERTVLVLAGSVDQIRKYDELMGIYHVSDTGIVIIGGGRVGRAAARALHARQIPFKLIEKDPSRLRNFDYYIQGSAADYETLEKAGLMEASSVIITPNDDDINIYLTLYCRKLRPDIQIISRSTHDRNINTLHRAGADFVMSYGSLGASTMFNILQRGEVLMVAEGLNVFRTPTSKRLVGKTLIESRIREKTGCSVIAMAHNGTMLANPDPSTKLQEHTDLIVVGDLEQERRFMQLCRGE